MTIFERIIAGELPSYKVMENEHAYAFFDINPVAEYHTLVIPKHPYVNIFDVSDEALRETLSLVRKVCKLYEEKLGMKNVQIFSNNGKDGQQEVFHLHYHIVPRWPDDGKNLRFPRGPEMTQERFVALLGALNN